MHYVFIYFFLHFYIGCRKSYDYKTAAVNYYLTYRSFVKTIKIFKCSKTTLWRWIHNIEYKHRNGAYKVSNEYINKMIETITKNNSITIPDLHKELQNINNISVRHLYRLMHDNNFTIKKKRYRYMPFVSNNKSSYKQEFMNRIQNIQINKIISLDETWISSGMTRNIGWSKIGTRITEIKSNNRKKRTIIAAISNNGVEKWKLKNHNETTSSNDILLFLQELLVDKNGYTIVLDNAIIHKSKLISEYVINSGNNLLYTPKYSPSYNPIEKFFSQLKYYIRKNKINNVSEIESTVSKSFDDVDKNNKFYSYFLHAFYKNKCRLRNHRIKTPKIYKNA